MINAPVLRILGLALLEVAKFMQARLRGQSRAAESSRGASEPVSLSANAVTRPRAPHTLRSSPRLGHAFDDPRPPWHDKQTRGNNGPRVGKGDDP